LRIAITAFIAGGSLLFFLPQLPSNWMWVCIGISAICLFLVMHLSPGALAKEILVCILLFNLGFAWNALYTERRLANLLVPELEGKPLTIMGRVAALPQSSSSGAKFAFEIDEALSGKEELTEFPRKIYLSWQPAWRNAQEIPEIIPGQRWKLKVKLKRPYGSLNPHTFDFERWAFHQNYGASGSVQSGELLIQKDIGFAEFELRMELARWALRQKIQSLLPANSRYVGVMIALVMGDQNAIAQDDWRVFNATGIGHLISITNPLDSHINT
jgi:competence protein ComEC